MRDVKVEAMVSTAVDDAYQRLADFPAYVRLASSVLSVEMGQDNATSDWEVTFRDGILRWRESDVYNVDDRVISFSQIDGDMDLFEGRWSVTETGAGSHILFEAVFDLGLPGLSDFLEPVAARALEENLVELLSSLFSEDDPQVRAECIVAATVDAAGLA